MTVVCRPIAANVSLQLLRLQYLRSVIVPTDVQDYMPHMYTTTQQNYMTTDVTDQRLHLTALFGMPDASLAGPASRPRRHRLAEDSTHHSHSCGQQQDTLKSFKRHSLLNRSKHVETCNAPECEFSNLTAITLVGIASN